ncbi:chloride channel protein [Odoribacter sp. OttesenSCG-928-J03]|nr:chloride channel protein [Odoribacter sp. OttesenSCG-928-J03]MDL2330419.1 chloride channel protein [Odoribacter sp. OttesenSCG-928-A06]
MDKHHDVGWFGRFLMWRVRYIKEKHFILFLSLLVGLISGIAAILLKNMVHFTHQFFTERLQVDSGSLLFFIYPFIGILLTSLFVRYYVKEDISHGVTKVLYAISRNNSIIKPHNSYTSMIASTITIGFGGSVGTEATIVLTGASIGSNLARFFRMNYKVMTLMIGCGAAGAIAGIFKAPIAGIVFTLEVLMLDLTMASLIPLMISAISAYVLVYFFMGNGMVLDYSVHGYFSLANIPYYIILGILCGLVSVYFIRMNIKVESWIHNLKKPFQKVLVGGLCLGLLIYIFPPLYGEGYNSLQDLLTDNADNIFRNTYLFGLKDNIFMIILFVVGLLGVKVVAAALTNGSGGVGGVFAPSLFTGGVAGFLVASLINQTGIVSVPVSYFVLAGMSGVMSGVMNAPLTAMFLIAEITGGYAMLVPLMITSVMSHLMCSRMEPHSIYARRLAMKGDLITHNKDKAVLTLMKLDKVLETDFKTVSINATLGDLVKIISRSSRNSFPVVDATGKFLGMVLLDDIRKIMFNQDQYDKSYVRDYMTTPPTIISATETMDAVMKKFEETGAWILPVIQDDKYIGFVSKAKIFNTYRRVLQHFSDE